MVESGHENDSMSELWERHALSKRPGECRRRARALLPARTRIVSFTSKVRVGGLPRLRADPVVREPGRVREACRVEQMEACRWFDL